MTKEEVIRRYEPYPNKAEVNVIGKMMDEYAKSQGTSFLEWIAAEGYVTYDGFDRWIAPHNSKTLYSANELYDMFLKSQQP